VGVGLLLVVVYVPYGPNGGNSLEPLTP